MLVFLFLILIKDIGYIYRVVMHVLQKYEILEDYDFAGSILQSPADKYVYK